MDSIINYITTHQFTTGVCVFVAFLILYFLFNKLIKLALLLLIALILFSGYLYLKDPHNMPKSIGDTMKKAKEETGSVVERGRGVYDSVKGVYKKGEKLMTRDVDKMTGENKKESKEK